MTNNDQYSGMVSLGRRPRRERVSNATTGAIWRWTERRRHASLSSTINMISTANNNSHLRASSAPDSISLKIDGASEIQRKRSLEDALGGVAIVPGSALASLLALCIVRDGNEGIIESRNHAGDESARLHLKY